MEYIFTFVINSLCVLLHISFAQENSSCSVEGEFFHNTLDCSTYLRCVYGIKVKMACPSGTKFNLEKKMCDWPENSDCEETVYLPSPSDPTIEEQCQNNPTATIPHPTECQLFYNCSIVYGDGPRVFEQHMDECFYPDYFDTETMQCVSFEDVDCGDYRRSWCPVAHCSPCMVGSCRCKTDGQHANDRMLWSPYYTECYKERAVGALNCSLEADGRTQIFHPLREICVPLYLVPKEHGGTMPICNERPNGNYTDSDYGCTSYAVCLNAQIAQVVQCEDGQVFDFVRRVCWDEEQACGSCGGVNLGDCEV